MKENQSDDLRATRRLLHEISQLCEHASLTGSLSGGAPRTVARFNTILAQLTDSGAVPEGLFSPLSDDSDYGEVGVEARMLASYIRDGEKDKRRNDDVHDPGILVRLAPFVDSSDLSALIREQMQQGIHMDMHILTSIAPFLGKEDLGKLLREHLNTSDQSDRGERRGREDRAERRERPERPERPDRGGRGPSGPFPSGMGWPFNSDNPEPAPQPSSSLNEVLEQLRRPDLTDEERDRLVRQVREMATE